LAIGRQYSPSRALFEEAAEGLDEEGRATASVVFDTPGEYMIRVRVDNFEAADSTRRISAAGRTRSFRSR
jgi:hypothetical protein